MATSFAQGAAKIRSLGQAAGKMQAEVVAAAAPLAEEAMLSGPPRVGLGRNSLLAGSPWGVRRNQMRAAGEPTVRLTYAGPVHWFEFGTRTHLVAARHLTGSRSRFSANSGSAASQARARGAALRRSVGMAQSFGRLRSTYARGARAGQRRAGARALNIPGVGYRASAMVTGMRPRPFWGDVQRRARADVSSEMRGVWGDALRRAGFNN